MEFGQLSREIIKIQERFVVSVRRLQFEGRGVRYGDI
jgi:hypothetical protein